MLAKTKITALALMATMAGLGSGKGLAQSVHDNHAVDGNGQGVAWKIFSSPFPSTSNVPVSPARFQDDTNPFSAISNDALTSGNGLTWSALQFPADAPAASPAAMTGAGTLPGAPAAIGQSDANHVTLSTSTQDLAMNGPRSEGIAHSNKSLQTTGTVSVPIPTAAWTGLTALLGLGLFAYWKKLAKVFA